MKQLFFIANWKSYKTVEEAKDWLNGFKIEASELENKEIIVCPPFTLLPSMHSFIKEHNLPIKLGAQDVSSFGEGSYTGAINFKHISEFVTYAVVGHSERRKYFHETDDDVIAKVKLLIENKLTPILCVSDMAQMDYYLANGKAIIENADKIIFVYEPPSAISGGGAFRKVSVEEANENAGEISKKINKKVITAYGGSVNIENAASLFKQQNIDGGLLGQASLNPETFLQIIKSS
jgi:triosephosphate isomerase